MTTLSARADESLRPRAGRVAHDPMLPQPYRVVATRQDTFDTHTLDLEPVSGPGLRFEAGQFTMLYAFGVGEVPISISSDPASPGVLRHTIRDVGGVTHAIVTARVGTVFGVRGPYGSSWEVTRGLGGDVLFVAGGIGLAPLRPAILQVVARRGSYGRAILLYGARSAQEFLFDDEVARWEHDLGFSVHRGVRAGLAHELSPEAGFDAARTLALMCGPDVMMHVAARTLVERGVPANKVRLSVERTMQCGVGLCGHCQLRELFLCVDGPVVSYEQVGPLLDVPEL